MKYDGLDFVLDNVKIIFANRGILGISADKQDFEILFNGYDGSNDGWEDQQLTTEERKEIAQYMIELWKEWAK